jgi:hypothetical protein
VVSEEDCNINKRGRYLYFISRGVFQPKARENYYSSAQHEEEVEGAVETQVVE